MKVARVRDQPHATALAWELNSPTRPEAGTRLVSVRHPHSARIRVTPRAARLSYTTPVACHPFPLKAHTLQLSSDPARVIPPLLFISASFSLLLLKPLGILEKSTPFAPARRPGYRDATYKHTRIEPLVPGWEIVASADLWKAKWDVNLMKLERSCACALTYIGMYIRANVLCDRKL